VFRARNARLGRRRDLRHPAAHPIKALANYKRLFCGGGVGTFVAATLSLAFGLRHVIGDLPGSIVESRSVVATGPLAQAMSPVRAAIARVLLLDEFDMALVPPRRAREPGRGFCWMSASVAFAVDATGTR
jgi:hypothetical protein